MTNKVTIHTLPVKLTDRQRKSSNWQFRTKIANQDLDLAQKSILRDLEQNIAVKFADEIVLTLSINTTTFKIKIDYSQIKSRKTVHLIKLYLSRDIEKFAKELMKLA